MKTIHLNDKISYKLTPRGKAFEFSQLRERLAVVIPPTDTQKFNVTVQDMLPKPDADGWCTDQLWVFMAKFGAAISAGYQLIEDNIIQVAD